MFGLGHICMLLPPTQPKCIRAQAAHRCIRAVISQVLLQEVLPSLGVARQHVEARQLHGFVEAGVGGARGWGALAAPARTVLAAGGPPVAVVNELRRALAATPAARRHICCSVRNAVCAEE